MLKMLYPKWHFKYQPHRAYSSLYQVQHFRHSLPKHTAMNTISSSFLPGQCSAPTQAPQECPQISRASAIGMGLTQQRTGWHQLWIRLGMRHQHVFIYPQELPFKGYSVCSYTPHTHTRKKKERGKKKRYRSLLTVIRQHCSSEVLMQPLLFYCSSNRMVMHTEVCAKGELREADIACVFGKPE